MSDIEPTADVYQRALTDYEIAFDRDEEYPVDAATNAGFYAGVEAERARIIAALVADANAAKSRRDWSASDAYMRAASRIESGAS